MRRQGRQHGVVRTYRILPPPLNPRLVNSLTSPLTAELFTKHTKAHRKVWPGQVHWVRSNDIASSSYKLLTWRVRTGPGHGPVLNLPGFSATRILDPEDNGGEAKVETVKTENDGDKSEKEDGGSHDDDESMSFYDVGMMMMEHMLDDDDDDDEEEDGWCLV